MFRNFKNDKRGMTLIEMIISLVILSILMTSTMGMVTSSISIFTSTSNAALDRMVGNSVYTTLENTLKYSTHLTISKDPITDNKSQSFYVEVSDPDNEAGSIQYRAKDKDTYISLYDPTFYNGRTIQYSVSEVGNDQRHVKIQVNIFRDGKRVYTKDAVVKCVNLSLIRSGTNANMISNKAGDKVSNQYLYFSVDELLISGGDTAWSIEYKLNEYMDHYNRILSEYYGKLGNSNKELTDALNNNSNTEGHRMQVDVLNTLLNNRDKAIFGDGTDTTSWEGDDYKTYSNLRKHYQDEVKDLLKFTPTHAISDADNLYYHVVATKEELYTGFLLNYYDKNEDGKIVKAEYPQMSDPSTYFSGTSMSRYAGDNDGMVMLAYFRDGLKDDYSKLFTKTTDTVVYTYTNTGMAYDPTQHILVSNVPTAFSGKVGFESFVLHPYTDDAINKSGGTGYSFRALSDASASAGCMHYAYNDSNTLTDAIGSYTEKNVGINFFKKNYKETFNDLKSRMGSNIKNIMDYASVSGPTTGVSVNSDDTSMYTFTINKDLPEGFYYYDEDSGSGFQAYHVFYIQAASNALTDMQGKKTAIKQDKFFVFFSCKYVAKYYYYEQAQYGLSDGVDAGTSQITTYNINPHQYADWILYGVDWNSWFRPTQDGFLNSIIGGVAGWFTGQQQISQVNGENADQVLGLKGKYNVENLSTSARSYNLAWFVYNPNRGTYYYIPDSSNRVTSGLSNVAWISNKNNPVPIDVTGWATSTAMIHDIETRKMSSSGLFGLIDTTSDVLWVPLPTGGSIDRGSIANPGEIV